MDNLKSDLAKLKQLTAVVEYDIDNLCCGTKAASTRARSKLMAISKLCASMRKDCMTVKNDLPSRSRKKAPEPEIDDPSIPHPSDEEVLSHAMESVKVSPPPKKSRKPRRRKAV